MRALSGEPNERSGYQTDDAVPQRCWRGHEWTAPMFYEWGGWFYQDDHDGDCPTCGAGAGEPAPGFMRVFLATRTLAETVKVMRRETEWRRVGVGRLLTAPAQEDV